MAVLFDPDFFKDAFLSSVLLTRHFNMKGHLSFVSVHIYLSAFQMVRWEVPEKVIFVPWVLGIHSIPAVFFRLYYASAG